MVKLRIREELLMDGVEFIPTHEPTIFLSSTQVEQAELLSCDEDGVAKIKLITGKTHMVDSIDLDYENE